MSNGVIVLERATYNSVRIGRRGEVFAGVFGGAKLSKFGEAFTEFEFFRKINPIDDDDKKLRFARWVSPEYAELFLIDSEDGEEEREETKKSVESFFNALKIIPEMTNEQLTKHMDLVRSLKNNSTWLEGFTAGWAANANLDISVSTARTKFQADKDAAGGAENLPMDKRGYRGLMNQLAIDAGVGGKAYILDEKDFKSMFELI